MAKLVKECQWELERGPFQRQARFRSTPAYADAPTHEFNGMTNVESLPPKFYKDK
jgi:hypothetical protein